MSYTKIGYKQKQIVEDYSQLFETLSLTGIVIDVSDMEGSGGGYYPSFKVENGRLVKVISPDVGSFAYTLLEMAQDDSNSIFLKSLNIWFVFFGEDGPTLQQAGSYDFYTA